MDDRIFRDAMGRFATGITVVTVDDDGEILGMTVNAFMSVSLHPQLIAISIDERASMYPILQEKEQFGLSILHEHQKDLSMIFARQKEQTEEIPFTTLDNNPVIKGSLATLSCYVKSMVKAGDHMILISEVTDIVIKKGNPLLYYAGEYQTINE